LEEVIKLSGKDPRKIVVAFDIDRTLRMGTSSGTVCRDPATQEVLQSLAPQGVCLLLITGAHADSNPNYVDATKGAVDRVKSVKLENFFLEEVNISNTKETIVRGEEWQIRYKGRIIVSQEKGWALDYYISCVYGAIDSSGTITEKQPELLIFVDDSDINILTVLNQFKDNTILSLPVICVFYEPTLEMFAHNPMDGDNPKPGCLEQVYQYQLSSPTTHQLINNQFLQQLYAAYNLPLPN